MPAKRPRIGIDIARVSRFARFKTAKHAFLQKIFTPAELAYCFARPKPAQHLAGFFAAKEAASKALGTTKYPFAELEVRHAADGAPLLFHKGKKLSASISISHEGGFAIAAAIG